jgi:hypothetical protein
MSRDSGNESRVKAVARRNATFALTTIVVGGAIASDVARRIDRVSRIKATSVGPTVMWETAQGRRTAPAKS